MRTKVIFFDLDDTLYDHTEASRDALRETMKLDATLALQSQGEVERINAHWLEHFHLRAQTGEITLEDARIARWREVLSHFGANSTSPEPIANAHRENYLRCERLVDGAEETLHKLQHIGCRLAIVSNSTRDEQLGKLRRLKIAHYFEQVIVSADYGFAKPDPRLFQIARNAMNCDATETMHLGDSWVADVEGALAAGIRPIWFNRFNKSAKIAGVPQLETLSQVIPYAT